MREDILNFDIPNPMKRLPRSLVDFQLCVGTEELSEILYEINRQGYGFLCATQHEDVYTVFFQKV